MLLRYTVEQRIRQIRRNNQPIRPNLTIDGKEVSRQSLAIGKGNRFNTAVEVQYSFSGTILAHTYKNNTFTFAAADPGFPHSLRADRGIVASKPVPVDEGNPPKPASPPKAGSQSS
ncbi:hypothetical protein E6O75_ATG04872 [Venturia nashicola]|uniref:Uncharacterized protein n=1 Tax=Venturia nashicola TaxID=86259 RepID=A0A4Z1PH44_9PEZI|nr:hypothetical protein E6O75_ATG04872 [Venturia nashicola]